MSKAMRIPEIDAVGLARELEAGADLQILDVRAPERLAAGRIDLGPASNFKNLPGSVVLALPSPAMTGLDPARPVVCVCGHGNSSLTIASYLCAQGFDALSLQGGMAAWGRALVPRELPPPPGFRRLLQFDRIGKGALGYLLISAGEALAIDPPLDFTPFETAARDSGAAITGVADTHVHADYISGAASLAAGWGAPYYLHPADNVNPFDSTPGRLETTPLGEGQEIKVGEASLRVVHTPGHTEGSVSLLAGDSAAFTGDFVFVDSLGRPDLVGRCAEWTPVLYASAQRALAQWPDHLVVYPAHYGSEGERNADHSIGLGFGEVKARNSSLRIQSLPEFSAWVESHRRPAPESYRVIKLVNAGLIEADEMQVEQLDAGRNECALK